MAQIVDAGPPVSAGTRTPKARATIANPAKIRMTGQRSKIEKLSNGGFIEENESVVSEVLFVIHRYAMELRDFREDVREITMR